MFTTVPQGPRRMPVTVLNKYLSNKELKFQETPPLNFHYDEVVIVHGIFRSGTRKLYFKMAHGNLQPELRSIDLDEWI
jgi:hypothetical protein